MRSLGSTLWSFIFMALCLHWLAYQAFYRSSLFPKAGSLGAKSEIEIERWADESKPIVRSSQIEPQINSNEVTARFSGEFLNRTPLETQSRLKGRFREAFPRELIPGAQDDPSDRKPLLGESRNPYALPKNIVEGSQTVLNTDPVLFASFINRIADEIHDPWVDMLQEAVKNSTDAGIKFDPNIYITKLLVVIDQEGHVAAIQTLQSSSIPAFDDAAKKSFWETEPFPNPPQQMFEKDGILRCAFEFHFEMRRSVFNIVPWAI